MANKIYLEPEKLTIVCDEMINLLEEAKMARAALMERYEEDLKEMHSDFIDRLKDVIDVSDLNAKNSSIDILENKMLFIKDSVEVMKKTDEKLVRD